MHAAHAVGELIKGGAGDQLCTPETYGKSAFLQPLDMRVRKQSAYEQTDTMEEKIPNSHI